MDDTTASQPAMASSAAASSASPSTTRTCANDDRTSARDFGRTSAVTSCPPDCASTCRPTCPVPPRTKSFTSNLFGFAARGAGRNIVGVDARDVEVLRLVDGLVEHLVE